MPPLLLLVLSGAVAAAQAGTGAQSSEAAVRSTSEPSNFGTRSAVNCEPQTARDVIVCAERRQGYRIDPNVTDAARQSAAARSSATSSQPTAQAACASQPTGCAGGLASLDLVNVAEVATTAAVKAARGKDWKTAFERGPDEYRLYVEAKRQREALEAQRAAQAARLKALKEKGAAR